MWARSVASSISLTKRSGAVDSTVVTTMDLSGASNTALVGTLVGANTGLLAKDSLRLDVISTIAGVTGAVLTVVIELA